ncbi:MAG TPA: fatty acyl-AMP ligase [Pyrinomonadaceae bacterium]
MKLQPSTIDGFLRLRASDQPARTAYVYLGDGEQEQARVTYSGLDLLARGIGATLCSLQARGERALLLYPPGLDFVAAFFGCLYSGVVAVPAYPPHPARPEITLPRLHSILADSQAKFVLTTTGILAKVAPLFARTEDFKHLRWLATDEIEHGRAEDWNEPEPDADGLAFLQYTSGSTNAPKGVMVSHRNLLENSAYIHYGFEHTPESISVTWLPAYHDMGLIDGIMQPLYAGFTCYLMPSVAFLQRPLRWLQAISRYRATHSGGPNFAYEHCVNKIRPEQRGGLDLSCWRVAYNGAEPIREETLRRFAASFEECGFRWDAFYPAYGLAEATLKVSGGKGAKPPVTCKLEAAPLEENLLVEASTAAPGAQNVRTLVGSGDVSLGTRAVIVEPASLRECPKGSVGEVWVSGAGVAQGYWNRPELTEQTFKAHLSDTGQGPFLRTGDLGFIKDGELFITGRLKDLIIIGGRNHYPQDIELTVEQCHPSLRSGCVAAFSVEFEGEESLVIAAEVDQRYKRTAPTGETAGAASRHFAAEEWKLLKTGVQRAIADYFGLHVHELVWLKVGGIPKTSSGKIRRQACRQAYLTGRLERLPFN